MFVFLAGYIVTIAIATLVLRLLRPRWSGPRLVFVISLPGPCLAVLIAAWYILVVLDRPAAPDEIDAGGMAMVAFGILAFIAVVIALPAGLLTSWATLRFWPRANRHSDR